MFSYTNRKTKPKRYFPWGKVICGILGGVYGGPWGFIIGILLGHIFIDTILKVMTFFQNAHVHSQMWSGVWDRDYRDFAKKQEQASFTMAIIVLCAKMARVDGKGSAEELKAFKKVFKVSPSREEDVDRLFNRAKLSPEGFESYAMQLAFAFQNRPLVLREILSALFMIAIADTGKLTKEEITFLQQVAVIFGISREEFLHIAARSGVHMSGSRLKSAKKKDSYDILGVSETANDAEIKSAYRKLIKENHPDKLISQGVAEEFINAATEKLKRINAAYDDIRKIRGIK